MKLLYAILASTALAASPGAAEEVIAASAAQVAAGQAQAPSAQESNPAASVTPAKSADAKEDESVFDSVWDAARLYKNDDSKGLNELRIVGRLHLDNYRVDSDQGDASDLVVRRARLGAKARLFRKLEAHVETELDLEGAPLYSRLTDAYLAWKFSDAARLTLGKHSVKFTLDGSTSSNELLTIDRSNVANNFWFTDEYIPGVSVSGKSGQWSYYTGVYSGGREDREFGDFDGGWFWVAAAGHDFGDALGLERALVRADFVYNEPDADSDFTKPFENIGALVLVLDGGRWGFSGDLVRGNGFLGQSDAVGVTALPWFSITDRLQLAGRYTFVKSDERNGVRLNRYENVVTGGKGDRYDELYAGLNYLIYGHKLKAQTGLSWADMSDRAGDGGAYDGWSWTTALRASW